MIPVVPDANPPCQSIVDTFGFHSPQVDMSDHTLQTFSGDAVVSTEVPYSRAIRFLPGRPAQLSTRVSAGGDVTSAAFSFVRFKRMMTPISNAVPTSCTP